MNLCNARFVLAYFVCSCHGQPTQVSVVPSHSTPAAESLLPWKAAEAKVATHVKRKSQKAGRRTRMVADVSQTSGRRETYSQLPLKALAVLLLTVAPAAAFSPSNPGFSSPLVGSSRKPGVHIFQQIGPGSPLKAAARNSRSHVPAMNGFLDLLRKPFMPTTGPISLEKKNFALPDHPDLVIVNKDPPVYEIPGFLSEAECAELVAAAENGAFPAIPYGQKNKIFTGTKWAAAGTEAIDPFLQRSAAVFGTGANNRFEPVTVTRYGEGEYQAEHLDSRLPNEFKRNEAHFKTGGQRIAQVIVYLQSPAAGGATKFFNPLFNDLEVKPEVGKALIFPTATTDGVADERYLHSGEPVKAGTKYIIGTWLMEVDRKDSDEIQNAIEQLWKLQRKREVR